MRESGVDRLGGSFYFDDEKRIDMEGGSPWIPWLVFGDVDVGESGDPLDVVALWAEDRADLVVGEDQEDSDRCTASAASTIDCEH